MRDIINKLTEIETLLEGKYGAHGKDLDNAIDKAIKKLGKTPSLEEIYKEVNKIRRNEDIGGFAATKSYREGAALGAIAKALGLPGLYKSSGNSRTFVTTEQDDANRFKASGSATKKQAKELAQKGYLTPEKAEKLGLELPAKQDDIDAQGAAAADAGMDNKPAEPSADDVDSMDSGTPEKSTSKGMKDGKLTLSDGSTFYRDGSGKGLRLFQKKVGGMIRRMDELVRKMNESVPNSLKAVLSESDKAFMLLEALSASEAEELVTLIADLELALEAQDDQGYFIGDKNRQLLRKRIDKYKPVIDKAKEQIGSASDSDDADSEDPETADDADSADSGTPDAPPEADKVSDKSGDQGAKVDPGEGSTAGSLEKFAKSGKGGLANDADESAAITELQQFLTDMGVDPNGVDGKYGNGTINAVKKFQGIFGAKVDGDAGPETIGKIVEYRNDLKEMDDLIAAAAAPQGGRGDGNAEVAQRRAAAQQQNASIDFRHLISLVEGKLFEALDDAQRTRAEELITKYEALVGNLPEPAKTTVQEKIDALKDELNTTSATSAEDPNDTDQGIDADDPGDPNDTDQGIDADDPGAGTEPGAGKATLTPERALKLVKRLRPKLGNGFTGLGTDEEACQAILKELQNIEDWKLLVKTYKDYQTGKKTYRYRTGDLLADLRGVMDKGEFQQYVAGELSRLGVDPGTGQGTADDEADSDPDATDPRGDQTDPSAADPEAGAEEPEADTKGSKQLASAKEVWNQIKAMRDKKEKGTPERRDLSNLMNQINVKTTTPEDAAKILAQAKKIVVPALAKQAKLDPAKLAQMEAKFGDTFKTLAKGTPEQQAKIRSQISPNILPYFDALLKKAQVAAGNPGLDQLPRDF